MFAKPISAIVYPKPRNMPAADQYITVQMPESEIYDAPPPYTISNYNSNDPDPAITGSNQKEGSFFKRHLSPSSSSKKEKTIGVRMTRQEFLSFFAKDHRTGDYRKDVIEPPGGRKKWLQERIEEFSAGLLDEGAYEGNLQRDYVGLRKESKLGKAADFMGQPWTPWAGVAIQDEEGRTGQSKKK